MNCNCITTIGDVPQGDDFTLLIAINDEEGNPTQLASDEHLLVAMYNATGQRIGYGWEDKMVWDSTAQCYAYDVAHSVSVGCVGEMRIEVTLVTADGVRHAEEVSYIAFTERLNNELIETMP